MTSAGAPVPAHCPPGTWSEEGHRTPAGCQDCSGRRLWSVSHLPIWPAPCFPGWANSLFLLRDGEQWPQSEELLHSRVWNQPESNRGGGGHCLSGRSHPHWPAHHWQTGRGQATLGARCQDLTALQTRSLEGYPCPDLTALSSPIPPLSRARLTIRGAWLEDRGL